MTELRSQLPAGRGWSGGHLALDAIVAYVDDELSPGAKRRALDHLASCAECAAEVIAQTQARWALRASAAPSLPSSLLSNLRAIPERTELPAQPAGLAMSSDGELVAMLREPNPGHRRRFLDRKVRLGAGALVSGIALGALMIAAYPSTRSNAPTASIGGAGVIPVGAPGPAAGPGEQAPVAPFDASAEPAESSIVPWQPAGQLPPSVSANVVGHHPR